ncbi:YraN family protein [Pasteurella skyensis]|uniref:UPF0102 protein QJU97_08860 n=1 Tax=Phocoenobacter skyensis TaxID=97481 RepID=A0AAJ6NF81_9PAST|nr:YraN family protein [Pasteurella skyensis]MDP8171347.1 YraN family protein [Pasteurella skyensis]MDP8175566.1 YraN family protein [Pasteurella skyensis]
MRKQGTVFEDKARIFLEENGLELVATNQTFKCGELDLVMKQGSTTVFVEVRQRKNANFGSAVESIGYTKQQKWLAAANLWLAQQGLSLDNADCRFDVVAFEGQNDPIWIQNFLD